MTSSLSPANDHQTLRSLAATLVEACPDMRQQAREVAVRILEQHGLQALDPDQVYLHRFHTAVSSPRTYNGWQHLDEPYESLSLPQLVMHRFDAKDQDNADLLSYLVGFYSKGPGTAPYDEHNEVRLDPKDVLDYFWNIDFANDFKARLKDFWASHADDFRLLAKANFMSKALEAIAREPSSILATGCRQAIQRLVGEAPWPPTMEALRQEQALGGDDQVSAFDIGGHVATDMLCMRLEDGSQLVYSPGDEDGLHLFANEQALFWWVLESCNHTENRARFMAHFSLDDREEGSDRVGLHHLIDVLYSAWGQDDYSGINTLAKQIHGDAFSWLRDKAHQRMLDDAHFALRSNGDLRKQMWIGYLSASLKVFGPLAALDWPVALAIVGAGLADTGLNIDQAINGHTTREREGGVIGAILAAIETLFNATFLLSAPGKPLADLGEAGEESVPSIEPATEDETPESVAQAVKEWVPEPFQPKADHQLLSPFETNVILSGSPGTGEFEGIYTQDGQFYVLIDELPYQVRYVNEFKSWSIVSPDNPFSFYRSQPIRLDADGQWYLVNRGGLKGGMLPRLRIWGRVAGSNLPPLAETGYEVPADLRPLLTDVGDAELSGAHAAIHDPERIDAVYRFQMIRDQLASDAHEFMATVTVPERPTIPAIPQGTPPKQILQSIYDNSRGMVIGESHSGLASKRLLIDNMKQLRKLKVKVLYLEHYTTDFQQPHLDTFNRTGRLPPELDEYISIQDDGHHTDASGRYTFRQVILEAQKNGVRIQGIDCLASYRQAWQRVVPDITRQEMMNFYAHRVIQADQALRGPTNWVALVGNSHANNIGSVKGLAELEGVLGLRVEDAPLDATETWGKDTGADLVDLDGKVLRVKSDLRLRATIKPVNRREPDLETLLARPGDYTLERKGERLWIVNRTRDMILQRTEVRQNGNRYTVVRPEWPSIQERTYERLSDLHIALAVLRRMREIKIPRA
ncbi:dermonecrotic toxin domain-containing protein [Pseudomonas sp. NPDC089752]|uniref:dermonecrotic toxin domain-containing protein n=1 Tax=Pseudomonas sp. NPDC089752 TaxID=3364472 RepID=UPI0037F98B55